LFEKKKGNEIKPSSSPETVGISIFLISFSVMGVKFTKENWSRLALYYYLLFIISYMFLIFFSEKKIIKKKMKLTINKFLSDLYVLWQ